MVTEAIQGEKTLSQWESQFKMHPIQIAKWRQSALERLPELFIDGRAPLFSTKVDWFLGTESPYESPSTCCPKYDSVTRN